jgi:hypothetical protein
MDRTGIDYPVLVATLQAWQLSTETARAERRCATPRGSQEAKEPGALTQILFGGHDWQQAVLAQGGSFNRLFARFAEDA